MYGDSKEHDYLNFYLLEILQVEHIIKVKMTQKN
jgi:hypothetical protein